MAQFNQTGQTVGNQVNADIVTVNGFGETGPVKGGNSLRGSFENLLNTVEDLRRAEQIDHQQYIQAVSTLREAQRTEAVEAPDEAAAAVKKERLTGLLDRLRGILGGLAAVTPLIDSAVALVRSVFGGQA